MENIQKNSKNDLGPNAGKKLTIEVGSETFARFPIRTHVIVSKDNMEKVVLKYIKPHLKKDDIVFISERVVAITQNRAIPIKKIRPSFLAKFLVKFVHKSPYGIGLGSPYTMELAIREVGRFKIIIVALISGMAKCFGVRGLFYKITGSAIAAIDGPCWYTLPPYNKYATLGPQNPDLVAKKISDILSDILKVPVIIIDANDLGVKLLGKSDNKISDKWAEAVFRDNPLGQKSEQTPLAIIRKVNPIRGINKRV